MVATRTNELPGTRAVLRYARFSATKVRPVLDLIRGLPVDEAMDLLRFTERGSSPVITKLLASAISNAEHNDELDGDSLYVAACYADEATTLKRWRPRARGRATRIRKRTCHITIIVSPMPDEMAARVEARQAASATVPGRRSRRAQESRRARVARSRGEAVTVDAGEAAGTEAGGEPTDEMVEEAEEAAAEEIEAEEAAAEAAEVEAEEGAAEEPDTTEPAENDEDSP